MECRDFLRLTTAGLASAWPHVALLANGNRARPADDRVPLWIDTDIGSDIDDAVCVFSAIHHPRVELLGVSTVRGCVGSVRAAA